MAFTTPRDWTGGEFVTEAMMDTHIRDNFLAMGPHLIARKTVDQTITSSAVLVDCTSMVLPVAANEVWQLALSIIYSSGTTEDMKLAFTFPTSGRIDATAMWMSDTATAGTREWTTGTSPTSSQGVQGGGTSTRYCLPIQGIYTNSTNAGNVTLQFAQNTSGGTATTIYANSTLWAVKLA
jgi:hypothetical protein